MGVVRHSGPHLTHWSGFTSYTLAINPGGAPLRRVAVPMQLCSPMRRQSNQGRIAPVFQVNQENRGASASTGDAKSIRSQPNNIGLLDPCGRLRLPSTA